MGEVHRQLVIDEWYARGNYHHNYGDGMDCYKVGVTLGSAHRCPSPAVNSG